MDAILERIRNTLKGLTREHVFSVLRWAVLVAVFSGFVLLGALLIGYEALADRAQSLALQEGQISQETIRAPFSIQYESEVLTDQARQTARDNVQDIYDPPDTSIARQQVGLARHILDYMADVRADEYASDELLVGDLRAITDLSLSETESLAILAVTPERWPDIDQQVMSVLEEVMGSEIRNNNIRNIKRSIPSQVSVLRFREDEVNIIVSIIEDLVWANTFYNEERTQQARAEAAASVPPETRNITQGQLIIDAGDFVDATDLEALIRLGLLQPEDRRLQEFTSAFLIMVLLTTTYGLYLSRFHPEVFFNAPYMLVLGVTFLLFVFGLRVMGPEHVVRPYFFPVAGFGLLLATLVSPQAAVVGVVGLAIILGVMAGNALPLIIMAAVGGTLGVLILRNTERLGNYFMAGTLVGVANTAVILVFFLTGTPADPLGALTLIGAGWVNGFMAALVAIGGLYLLGSVFNYSTSLRLLELNQPNQPLLQRLLHEAPGTYQHSLLVANLAELAAQAIGANATLTRVGAMYHDVGKMHAPHFFSENQVEGINPHDQLNNPQRSAQILRDHVCEGDKMARKQRLPARVRDFIREHHGTTRSFFYYKAVEQAGGDESAVDPADYTYPGPRPQSRETAILMLADGCESAVRSLGPTDKEAIVEMVEQIFAARIDTGQLDDSNLTLSDLHTIREVFIDSLQSVFHPRIAYPGTALQDDEPATIDDLLDTVSALENHNEMRDALVETIAEVLTTTNGNSGEPTTPESDDESSAKVEDVEPTTEAPAGEADEPVADSPVLETATKPSSAKPQDNSHAQIASGDDLVTTGEATSDATDEDEPETPPKKKRASTARRNPPVRAEGSDT